MTTNPRLSGIESGFWRAMANRSEEVEILTDGQSVSLCDVNGESTER